MSNDRVALVGVVPNLKSEDMSRLAVYFVRGNDILAQGPVAHDGKFRVDVSKAAASAHSNYGLQVVIGPAGMSGHLTQIPKLARIPINRGDLHQAERTYHVPADKIHINPDIVNIWWRWCRNYCVSGTVVGPNGCPVPGAQVTVNTITHTGSGYTKTPRVTVSADSNGFFTACFNWCTCGICRFCWPCWPHWWICWPWWWELDILHIIDHLEQIPQQIGPVGPGPVERIANSISLARPNVKDLVRGAGFASAHRAEFAPDPARTELIKRKLSNPALRAIFPWWWWCCDDPNITFTVKQGPTTILDEDPAMETRWCFEDGSTVVLVGNSQTVEHCSGDPLPESGFAWTRVGLIPVANIHAGYADSFGGTNDLAFFGTLDLYGGFAPGSGVQYYQVEAAQWGGDPSRGGTPPVAGSATAISPDLYNYLYIFDGGGNVVFSNYVKMGPFTGGGITNLYATEQSRRTAPTGTGLDPLPAIPALGFELWAFEGRKVYADASSLIAGNQVGAVDLTLAGFDSSFAGVSLSPDAPLTLTIDNQALTTAHVNSITAFISPGVPATLTGTGDCPAYDLGTLGFVTIDMTVSDANGHLDGYEMDAEWGHGHTAPVPPTPRSYNDLGGFPPAPYQSPDHVQRSFGGGNEVFNYRPTTSCCFEFRIRAGKRVTNGYTGPAWGDYDFQTISLKVS
jgi:hypothetical protein